MSIDWITVAAQIANFLVLVWLLKRFLYRPILDGIDAREAEISDRMKQAVLAKEKAEAAQQIYHDKTQALNVAQADLTETIRQKAEEQRDILLAEARKRVEQEHVTWKAHLDEEAQKYVIKMHQAGAGALLALTRKALVDLSDETLESRMARHLIQQIKLMEADLRRAAGAAAEAVVTSHGPLPEAVQADFTAELRSLFPQIGLRFETSEEQAPGLVLRLGGAQVAWTVDSYIDGLDALIEAQLATGTERKAQMNEG